MATSAPLCALPAPPTAGCCEPQPQAPPVPAVVTNAPGRQVISYRIGDFTSFRRAMLNQVARADLLGAEPNPFTGWHEGLDGDYHTALIELWAYLADILTFYQERIANEAFLPTATQRDSLARLARVVGYRPAPGSAASGLVAFSVARDAVTGLPAGLRVATQPRPGQPAATFETSGTLTARAEHNAIAVSTVAPTNQFAPLGALPVFRSPAGFGRRARSGTIVGLPAQLVTRTIVLAGAANDLAAGSYVLVVQNEGKPGEQTALQALDRVAVDRAAATTTIAWTEQAARSYQNVTLYAMRVTAAPFGANSPPFELLPPTLTGTVDGVPGPLNGKDWDDLKHQNKYAYLPNPDDMDADDPAIYLDAIYPAARGTPTHPAWVALVTAGQSLVLHVTDARPVSHTGYAAAGRVTRLTPGPGEQVPRDKSFPLRATEILAGSDPLTLQDDLPLPGPQAGRSLVLTGLHPHLADGQTVVVSGTLYDPAAATDSAAVPAAEAAVLDGPPTLDPANELTTVNLTRALANAYQRAGLAVMANVVAVTQGETVKREILGSGDGTALQHYTLKQKPLTYLPATDAEGLSAVQSTLLVTINGVAWTEQPTLLGSGPGDQQFTTSSTQDGQATVTFGDGEHGARPPTGQDNILARYRKGLGSAGNVAARAVSQLIDRSPGLSAVTNPLPTLGGADAASVDQIRAGAPGSVRTFARAVSASDYAALALAYPGVAKASAAWILRDPVTGQSLAEPHVRLTVATANETPVADQAVFARALRGFLDLRRDPNVRLRIADFVPVYVDVAITVDLQDNYPRQGTLAAVTAAIGPAVAADGTAGWFAFPRLDFGQSIHLSALYTAVQAIPGVAEAMVTTLRRPDIDPDPSTIREDIFVRPTELVIVPSDATAIALHNARCAITLGQGGFVDT